MGGIHLDRLDAVILALHGFWIVLVATVLLLRARGSGDDLVDEDVDDLDSSSEE